MSSHFGFNHGFTHPHVYQILSGDILNRDVLHHIPHFLHHVPQLHADDHLLVYQWSGCYVDVSAIDEGRIREFARVLSDGGFENKALREKFPMTIKKKEHGAYGAFFRDDIPVPKGPTKITF